MTRRISSRRANYFMLVCVAALVAGGLVVMYSISPVLSNNIKGNLDRNYYFVNQVVGLVAGLAGLVVASRINYKNWQKFSVALLILGFLFSLALLIPGVGLTINGATRWLRIGRFNFQPAELVKFSLIVYLAAWISSKPGKILDLKKGVLPITAVLSAAALPVLLLQRDMGTMLVLTGAAIAVLFAGGIRLRHFAGLLGVGLILLLISTVAFPHRLSRFATFFNRSSDVTGESYHINQALIAIGSGGVGGVGLGKSIQVYGYLPEAANDSIFAIIAEEFGLIGSFLVIGLFGVLAFQFFRLVRGAPDNFSNLLVIGFGSVILMQAILNISAMLALVPLTGVPLPFISYGGSSLAVSLMMIGVMFNISRYSKEENADIDGGRRHIRPHFTNASVR